MGTVDPTEPPGYALIPSLSTTLGVRPMIVTGDARNMHTLAHETLHMLLDDVHPDATTGKHNVDFELKRRLWSGGENRGFYTDRVRISKNAKDYIIGDLQSSNYAKP
jgi:hypothetical protein